MFVKGGYPEAFPEEFYATVRCNGNVFKGHCMTKQLWCGSFLYKNGDVDKGCVPHVIPILK